MAAILAAAGWAVATPAHAQVSYKDMADALHAVMESDRTVYTRMVVNRLQNEEKVIKATEHFKDDKSLPLPAQMFRFGAEMVAEKKMRLQLLAAVAVADQQAEPAEDRAGEEGPGGGRQGSDQAVLRRGDARQDQVLHGDLCRQGRGARLRDLPQRAQGHAEDGLQDRPDHGRRGAAHPDEIDGIAIVKCDRACPGSTRTKWRQVVTACAAVASALVFGSLAASPAGAQKFPDFPDPRLKQGRAVWLGTCEACHANDVAGAPLVGNKASVDAAARKGQRGAVQERARRADRPQGNADAAARRQRQADGRPGADGGRLHGSYRTMRTGRNDICKP